MHLPPLTEKIGPGAPGGHEFERLVHQLLLRHADKNGYVYRPVYGAGGDAGVDGVVPAGGVPGLDGPVAFQLKWIYGDIHKGVKARQIRDAVERAQRHSEIRHCILVTPWDLKPPEEAWLQALPVRDGFRVHHWGQTQLEQLFALAPALFARYYPHAARPFLDGYDGFDFGTFAKQYREKLALAHRKLRTLGLPPETLRARDAAREIRLRDVFVPLKLVPRGETESRPLVDFLHSERSLVVLGDPGTGKSVLLTFLALLFAGEAELEGFRPSGDIVPLHVPLRDFMWLQKTKPGLSFPEYLAIRAREELSLAQAHPAFFEATLAMGKAVVLLDGIDSVGGESKRRRMANAVRAFRAEYPDCPFWVTSRIYGYTRDVEMPDDEFATVHIDRLDDGQIDDFVGRWYQQQLPHNERERQERTQLLRRTVHKTPSVRRLAGNPLLLTLMVFIHQGLRRLPQDRGELYGKCVEMLLRTWQEARQGEEGSSGHRFERLGLHIHTQKDYLAHLAMHVQEKAQESEDDEGRGIVSRDEALDCLAERHLQLSKRMRPELGFPQAREEMVDFLDYTSDQTGLLIDRGGDQVSFIHLSLQEYLAAWVFICSSQGADTKFFVDRVGLPAWEEVLLLRLYIVLRTPEGGGPEVFDAIVRELLDHLDRQGKGAERGWLTMTRMVRDNLELAPEDTRTILRKAVAFRRTGSSQEWSQALEEVRLFADKARPVLQEILDEAQPSEEVKAGPGSPHEEFTQLVTWAGALLERSEHDGMEVETSRQIGAGRYLLRARLPEGLQKAYGTAPEVLVLAVEGEVRGSDLERVRDERHRHEISLDLDLFLVVDDRPKLAERLERMFQSGEQWVAWPPVGGVFPPLEEVFRRHLPSQDVFEIRDAVRGHQVFGRTEVVFDLSRRLLASQAVGVFGLRKVGKTTVVRAVTDQLDPISTRLSLPAKRLELEDPSPVQLRVGWLDAGHVHERTLDHLSAQLRSRLERRLEVEDLLPQGLASSGSELSRLDRLLDAVLRHSQLPLAIVLDEYDLLFEGSGGQPGIQDLDKLFQLLRAYAQETSRLALVVIGRDPAFFESPEMGGRTNPMLGWFVPTWLGPLEPSEADTLLVKLGRRVALAIGSDTQRLAASWTGGHPLLHRQFGSALLKRACLETYRPEHVATDPFRVEAVDFFLERHEVMTICREVFHLLSTRYTEACTLLDELSHTEGDLATAIPRGAWHGPEVRVLRDFGLLLGTSRSPWVPEVLRWYSRNIAPRRRRRA